MVLVIGLGLGLGVRGGTDSLILIGLVTMLEPCLSGLGMRLGMEIGTTFALSFARPLIII